MADTLCGPSNALQHFQKHTSVDRSLQQDRLTSRRIQGQQGFRSDHGFNAGILDPEFEAFQAGISHSPAPAFAHPHEHFTNAHSSFRPQHQIAPQSPGFSSGLSGGWANDFAQLRISEPAAIRSPLVQTPVAPSWHLDFQNFQRQQQQQPTLQQPQQHSLSTYSQPMGSFYNNSYQMASSTFPESSQTSDLRGKERAPVESQIDAAAFEREFEAHATAFLQEQQELNVVEEVPVAKLEPEPAKVEAVEDISKAEAEVQRSGNLDDLAATAGELLNAVSDNISRKFAESSFLSLMRQLRDGEAKVEGDKIVTVNETSSKEHASTTPSDGENGQDEDRGRAGYAMSGALQQQQLHQGDQART